jgi:hypothetical protein
VIDLDRGDPGSVSTGERGCVSISFQTVPSSGADSSIRNPVQGFGVLSKRRGGVAVKE